MPVKQVRIRGEHTGGKPEIQVTEQGNKLP
jgi:hypothetical protein